MGDINLFYRFHTVNSEEFKNGTPIDKDIYFITDTHEIYRGSVNYTNNIILYTGNNPVYCGKNKLYINPDTLEVKIYNNNKWITIVKPYSGGGTFSNKYSELEGKPGDEFEYNKEINIISIDPNGELEQMYGLYSYNIDTDIIYDISEGDSIILYGKTQNGEIINIGTGIVFCNPETDEFISISTYQQGHYCFINSSSNSIIDCIVNGSIPILDESKNYAFAIVYAKSLNSEKRGSTINISSSQNFSDIIIDINKNITVKENIKLPNSALSFDSQPTEGSDNLLTSDTIYKALREYIKENDNIPSHLSDLEQDSNYRTVSDAEKNEWNAKSNFDGNYGSLNNIPEKFNPINHSHNVNDIDELSNTIADIINIASGKCNSFIFDTIDDLDIWLSNTSNIDILSTGDIFLIKDINVPDYWWDGSSKQILETTKIDLSSYAPKDHKHTTTDISNLTPVAISGSYKDLSNIPIVSNKGNAGSDIWYFPLGEMVIDNSGNYGNFTFTGRFGGWIDNNTAVYSIMLMNRGRYDGNIITSTVSAYGNVAEALSLTDIVVAKNNDLSHTVYLKCTGYFCFDFSYTEYQHTINYNGSYITEEPANIIWRLSEAPKTILSTNGVFSASGGIAGIDEKIATIINRITTEIQSL